MPKRKQKPMCGLDAFVCPPSCAHTMCRSHPDFRRLREMKSASLDAELATANRGWPIKWIPLKDASVEALRAPWIYYRPLGLGLIDNGSHDRIANVLCRHEGHTSVPDGGQARLLMEVAAYAFNSGMAVCTEIPPLYRIAGPLTQDEILALSAAKPLMDFDKWYQRRGQ